MKALMFDPRVKEIVDASRLNLERLLKERDEEIKLFENKQANLREESVN